MSKDYYIVKDKAKLQIESIKNLMKQTYWAPNRSEETIINAIENSICYGLFNNCNDQVGFARVITDYATTYYICDVIINKEHRGKGLGKAMIEFITQDSNLKNLYGILLTSDAHELYKKYGFERETEIFMHKIRK